MGVHAKLSVYVASNTIRIFKSTIKFLDVPKYIRFRVNDAGTSMMVEPYDKKTFISFKVPKNLFDTDKSMEVHSKAFCQLLASMMNWRTDCSYRLKGILVNKHKKVAIFDLTSAEVIRQDWD